MAKKKKEIAKTAKQLTDEVWEQNPCLHDIIDKKYFAFTNTISENTKDFFGEEWANNVKANIKSGLWHKCGGIVDDCYGLGKNKGVIGVGAGPSLSKNQEVLKYFVNYDGMMDWDNRSFITIVANHHFKPLLEMGVIPDFVMLIDASDVVYDQLCTDIPKIGKNTILLTGLHCSPKVLNEWHKQGREIRFFVNTHEAVKDMFKRKAHANPQKYLCEMGGNILNGSWSVACQIFRSFSFFGVGNDLSYKPNNDVEEQRKGYYADGDYSTNAWGTGTGRDEAGREKKWAGISKIENNRIIVNPKGLDRYNIELDIVGTSQTLWVYKTWLESTILRMAAVPNNHLHYFNCTEGGILGVMAKEDSDKALKDKNNWYLLDEKCRCYHTAKLGDALEHFIKCKEIFECQSGLSVVQSVAG